MITLFNLLLPATKAMWLLFILNFFMFYNTFALKEQKAAVGGLCTDKCDHELLYCSTDGVCLCNQEVANFVYEYKHHFTIREPFCEVLPCTLSKPQDKNECNLGHVECIPHKDGNDTVGYCKCPGKMLGARRGTAFTLSNCKDVIMSSVGQKCISNLYICDITKKLKCRDGMCECLEGHLFSFEEDICIKEEEYVEKYGYDNLGSFKQYCSHTDDCHSGMHCRSKRCDCPNFCRSGKVIENEDVCYCAFDMTKLAYIIPCIVISIIFLLFFCGFCYYNKQYEDSLQNNSNLVLVHGRKTPISSIPHYLYKDGGRSPFITPVSCDRLSPPTQIYAPHSPNYNNRSSSNLRHLPGQESEETNWSPVEGPQELCGADLHLQAMEAEDGGGGMIPNNGTYSFFPPPPYQLNEMVAAEMVEAQMRQDSPSTVQYMETN